MNETLSEPTRPGVAGTEAPAARSERSLEEFWDNKILHWEDSAYGPVPAAPLARVFHNLRSSIRARLNLTAGILAPYLQSYTRVLDLGCGSGILGERLLGESPCRYEGIDLSGRACERARERLASFEGRARITRAAALETPWPDADIVVALGLLDWLEASEIDALLARLSKHRFVFSFSEASPSLAARVHRLWLVRRTQIMGTPARAHHHSESYIREVLERHSCGPVRFVRDPAMRFGVLVTNLEENAK
ncbi:MAG: class I SAM-dependent methyltransferase [Chrysiogenetes bacterium]|nr:class I SAM-dependent methyltransferase [Chrysiogenetes bacterium]